MSYRALIVDDNIALARVTQFALDRAGFETQIALNGQMGLELAQESQFDIVVTDQQMPIMSGIELCRALRELPNYFDCPLLLLTAKGLELELPKLREEIGINGVFCKPFSPAAVVSEVKKLLNTCVQVPS